MMRPPGHGSVGALPVPAPLPVPVHAPVVPPQQPRPNFEEMFNYVLNANDLHMVLDTCSRYDPKEVFASCNLGPMILLPLVQQLGSDLSSRGFLAKLKWLHAALIRLDPRDPLLADVLPDVLQQLRASIDAQRSVERDPNAQKALMSLHGLVTGLLQQGL